MYVYVKHIAVLERQSSVMPLSVVKMLESGSDVGIKLPLWLSTAAKLLNGGEEGADWVALAGLLGMYFS